MMEYPTTSAAVQVLALCVGVSLARRFPAMLIAIAASLIPLLIPAGLFNQHTTWERAVWFPCAIVLIPAQAVAAMEALFKFGEDYWLAPRIAYSIGFLASAAGVAFLDWPPHGDFVGQAVQVATAQRVWCFVYLALAIGFYASVAARDLVLRPAGAHLILLTVWMAFWMIPAIRPIPQDWTSWLATDWMVSARAAVMVVWIAAVALRREPHLYRLNPC